MIVAIRTSSIQPGLGLASNIGDISRQNSAGCEGTLSSTFGGGTAGTLSWISISITRDGSHALYDCGFQVLLLIVRTRCPGEESMSVNTGLVAVGISKIDVADDMALVEFAILDGSVWCDGESSEGH